MLRTTEIVPLIYVRNPQIHAIAKAVGRITTSQSTPVVPKGTAFFICADPLLIMTNYHVLDSGYDDKTRTTETLNFDYVKDVIEESSVQFSYYQSKGRSLHLAQLIADDYLCYSLDLDYMIMRIEPQSADLKGFNQRKPIKLKNPSVGQGVRIIQHAKGMPKSYSMTTIDAILSAKGDRMCYNAKTENGSSGSPVFNNAWAIIALHNAECEVKPLNKGIPIECICEDLRKRYPNVAKILDL